jgi:hypothetical protein
MVTEFSYRGNQMAEQHSAIIEFPRGKYIGRPLGDPPKDEAERLGWIAATLAKCSTIRGRYRIRPKIGANKI